MKKILLLTIIICYTSFAAFAHHDYSSSQNQNTVSKTDTNTIAAVIFGSGQEQLSQLLSSYYKIKNSLVADDAISAAANADLFLKALKPIDDKVISEGTVIILSKNAGKISGTKDLNKQREYFVDLSASMTLIAKSSKFSNQPIYLQYCPMKNASWLSSEKQIRNPYYGSSMLTCGEITEKL